VRQVGSYLLTIKSKLAYAVVRKEPVQVGSGEELLFYSRLIALCAKSNQT